MSAEHESKVEILLEKIFVRREELCIQLTGEFLICKRCGVGYTNYLYPRILGAVGGGSRAQGGAA